MEYVIMFVIVVIGCVVYNWLHNMMFTDGTLKIDSSNPDKDVYRIELEHFDSLAKKKRLILKVDPNADLSQE